MTRESAGLQ